MTGGFTRAVQPPYAEAVNVQKPSATFQILVEMFCPCVLTSSHYFPLSPTNRKHSFHSVLSTKSVPVDTTSRLQPLYWMQHLYHVFSQSGECELSLHCLYCIWLASGALIKLGDSFNNTWATLMSGTKLMPVCLWHVFTRSEGEHDAFSAPLLSLWKLS